MKFTKALFTFCCIGSLALTSCFKNDGDNNDIKDGTNQGVDNLMPSKAGSKWRYDNNEGKVFERTATGRDSVKDGYTYQYYEMADVNSSYLVPEYYAKFDDRYFMMVDLDGTQTSYIRAIICKDNPKVGDSWENTGNATLSGFNCNVKIEGQVKSITETYSTIDTTFQNVIKVENNLKARTSVSPWINCGKITMWFVEGVGLVKEEYNIDINLGVINIYSKYMLNNLSTYYIAP